MPTRFYLTFALLSFALLSVASPVNVNVDDLLSRDSIPEPRGLTSTLMERIADSESYVRTFVERAVGKNSKQGKVLQKQIQALKVDNKAVAKQQKMAAAAKKQSGQKQKPKQGRKGVAIKGKQRIFNKGGKAAGNRQANTGSVKLKNNKKKSSASPLMAPSFMASVARLLVVFAGGLLVIW